MIFTSIPAPFKWGIGTSAPSQELDIASANPTIELNDTDGTTNWLINGNPSSGFFDIQANGVPSFTIETGVAANTLYLDSTDGGRVGVGTGIPNTKFEVIGDTSRTRVRVENTNATDALRTMFSAVNNGPVNVAFIDKSPGGKDWNFRGSQAGPFAISENSSSVVEMTIGVGTGGPTFAGSVKAPGFVNTSTREAKEEFQNVDVREVLTKIINVPVSTWKYKHDDKPIRHMGPMAEDFNAAFHLGINDKTINTIDATGVTIAAIQGLHQLMLEKEQEIAELEAQNKQLGLRLAQLEAQQQRVDALEQIIAKLVTNQTDTLRHTALVQ